MEKYNIINQMALQLYGWTKAEALAKQQCIECRKPVEPDTMRDLDRREYSMSGLCPYCYGKTLLDDEW